MHNDFTLFSRKVPSGKTVVYYYAYDDEGHRLGPWSTGEASKTAARNYCNRLNREGKLLPGPKGIPTFEEFSQGFWDWETSEYLKAQRKRKKLTRSYADKNLRLVNYQLVPYFGNMKLNAITPEEIENWFDVMRGDGYKNTTINGYFGTLKTMMKYAAKKKIIPGDPLVDIERLLNDRRDIKIITRGEFKAMFVSDWRKVWKNDSILYKANKLAALTGMRCSEILGLRGEYVYDDHIFLCGQYDEYGYRETKTKIKHHIPLTEELVADLRELMAVNGQGYLFSLDGGATPVTRRHIYNGYIMALHNIGMSDTVIAARGLNVHAWRHFCNTELQKAGLSIQKVQAVTGHKSERSTELYTHFDPSEFGEVPKVQADLLKPEPEGTGAKNKGVDSTPGRPNLTLVKQPGGEGNSRNKKVS
jgi:integrase